LDHRLVFHHDDCAICRQPGDLLRISEFGKAVCRGCLPHFVQRRIESLMRRRQMYKGGDTIAVAISGGKDSAALAHILHCLRRRLRISMVGLHVNMNLGAFSEASEQAAVEVCDQLQTKLHISRVADLGVTVRPVGQFHQCGVCGAVRRALLNRLSAELGVSALATGHSLEDILQFMLKGILSGRLQAPRPVLPALSHRPRRIKPLYFTPEAATEAYAQLLDLPSTDAECSHFVPESHRFKQVFELLEQQAPMGKIQFAHTMLKTMRGTPNDELQRSCADCGEPTNAVYCPICRLRRAQHGSGSDAAHDDETDS
jgi:tRNA-5-methyluridine54 2-sulfurtransferase